MKFIKQEKYSTDGLGGDTIPMIITPNHAIIVDEISRISLELIAVSYPPSPILYLKNGDRLVLKEQDWKELFSQLGIEWERGEYR